MASTSYQSAGAGNGIGGKSRKVPSRRTTPKTPYDRPPSALRAPKPPHNGWISKFVEPASSLVARTASRMFSSVFSKRLTAPPTVPDYSQQQSQDVPEAPKLVENPSNKVQDHPDDGKNTESSPDGAQLGVSSSDGTFELEKLLKEKTFNRAEFEQLSELLRSRMVESSQSRPGNNLEQITNINVSELADKRKQMVLQSESVQLPNENDIIEIQENESLKLQGCLTPSFGKVIHKDFAASPAEIAKAYMGSRSSKVVPATLASRNHTVKESRHLSNEKNPYNLQLVPSPVITGSRKISENGFTTPRIHGRSAMHRMSRSPFFKLQTGAPYMGGRADNAGPSTTYELPSTSIIHNEDKKALKRRISDLDDGVAFSGHIRRIRQKYQVVTPLSKLSSGHTLPSWDQYGKDSHTGGVTRQKPLHLEKGKYAGKESTAVGDAPSPVSVVPVPLRSSEMARKIFQQLDKMTPSPKEKSSELKVSDRNESPSSLTNNMLHGRALKSMQQIDFPNFLKVHEVGNLDAGCGAIQERLPGLVTGTHDKGEANGFMEQHAMGLEFGSKAFDKGKSAIIVSEAKSSILDAKFTASGAANFAISNKPAFQISAPEDFFDLDEENNELEDPSGVVTRDKKLELISASLPVNGEMACPQKHIESLPKPMPSTKSGNNLEKNVSDGHVEQNNNGFTFSSAPGPVSSFLPPVSSVSSENSGKEKVSTSLGATTVSGNSAIKYDERFINSSNAFLPEDNKSEKTNNSTKGESLFSTFGSASAGLATSTSPPVSFSKDSVTSGLSGDIPPVTSKSPSVIAATYSNSSVTSVANSSATTSSSVGLSRSATAPVFSTGSPFQFGSSNFSQTSKPPSLTTDKLNATTLETGSTTTSPSFGINGATLTTSAPPLSSASSNSALSSVFSSSVSSSSPSPSLFSNLNSSGSAPTVSASSSANYSFAFGAPSSSAGLISTISSSGPQTSKTLGTSLQSNSRTVSIPETEPTNGVPLQSQGSSSQFGSFTSTAVFGLSASSSPSPSPSLLAPAADPEPHGLGTGPTGSSLLTASGSSLSSVSNTSFAPATTFGSSPGFSFSASAFPPSISGSGSSLVSGSSFTSSSGFSFSASVASSSTSSNSTSFLPSVGTSLSTSTVSTPPLPVFGSTFSSATSSFTGFSFGSSASLPGSSPFTIGASSGSVFSSSSAGNTNSLISPTQSNFGVQNQFASHASGSPGNDQMNMEDSMSDDPVPPSIPIVSSFGHPASVPAATPSFIFGSPAIPSSTPTFQFGSQQSFSVPQNPSPFQNNGNLEFAGGSFSLGSADKSGRRIVKAKRDKHRKK